MKQNTFVLKGDLCYSAAPNRLETMPGGFWVVEDGRSAGVFRALPERYQSLPLLDWTGKLVIPGLVDLHLHAPQYALRGLGMDLELLEWLEQQVFPEESRYQDLEYARAAYTIFAQDLRRSPTTRACIFATAHTQATRLLMDCMEETGLVSYVGRVNMDRNCPDGLRERDAQTAAQDTLAWLDDTTGRYQHVRPILTPRFLPTCSDELLRQLAGIQRDRQLPLQSHLSENLGEAAWVKELCPSTPFYGAAYDAFGLFGTNGPVIMAHCVLSSPEEMALLKERGVWVAHCPQSNANLSSGIAPVRRYLELGLNLGLGSDIAGGSSPSIFRAMADAIQVSKLRWRIQDDTLAPLTMEEAFWLGTAGGGSFFGQVGSFAAGWEADALVLDDSRLKSPKPLTLPERLERMIYLGEEGDLAAKYVQGRLVWTRTA